MKNTTPAKITIPAKIILPVIISTEEKAGKYFQIEFRVSDFDRVLEELEKVTLETISSNPLWKVM